MSCKILSRKAEVASKRLVEPPNYSNGTICETTAPCSSRMAASCCIATDFAFHRRSNPGLTGSAPVATHQLNFRRRVRSEPSTCAFRSSSTPLWQVWHPKVAPNSLRGHFFSGAFATAGAGGARRRPPERAPGRVAAIHVTDGTARCMNGTHCVHHTFTNGGRDAGQSDSTSMNHCKDTHRCA